MRRLVFCLALALAVLWSHGGIEAAAGVDGLIAIDILLLPDATMVRHAKTINGRLLRESAGSFALNATHVPHMTLLQCYVRRADLPAVEAAVARVFDGAPPEGMILTATGLFNSPVGPVNATGISAATTPPLGHLQHDIDGAVMPFIRHGGTAKAFFDASASPTIGWTIAYVDHFLANSSGAKFSPHVTAGAGDPQFVAQLQAAPFRPFHFTIRGAAIYQLGDIGTARHRLWRRRP